MGKRQSIPALISMCHLGWKRYVARRCLPHKISLKQLYLLRMLKLGPVSPRQAAEALFCDPPTESVILGNLVKQGWAERRENPRDRRGAELFITEAGRAKLAGIESAGGLTGGRLPHSCLEAEEAETLRRLLEKVHVHLENNFKGE